MGYTLWNVEGPVEYMDVYNNVFLTCMTTLKSIFIGMNFHFVRSL